MKETLEEKITLSPFAQEAMHILGELWWLFIIVCLFMVFRETIKSFVTSLMVLRSGTYEVPKTWQCSSGRTTSTQASLPGSASRSRPFGEAEIGMEERACPSGG